MQQNGGGATGGREKKVRMDDKMEGKKEGKLEGKKEGKYCDKRKSYSSRVIKWKISFFLSSTQETTGPFD